MNDDAVAESLLVQRALPHIPPPLWRYMKTSTLFNQLGEETPRQLKPHRPAPSPSPSLGRASSLGAAAFEEAQTLPINFEALRVHLMREGRVKPSDAYLIMNSAMDILRNEKNVLYLKEPVTVVGDIHGQFYDLVKLLELGGQPTSAPGGPTYLFLGDYVDRGCFSTEVVLLLFTLKVCFPQSIFMTRGNHEARHLTTYFNFKVECLFKYSVAFYDKCVQVFDLLPLAAMIGNRYFCVHGGLSPDVTHVDDILQVYRQREVPSSGAMCDLLWSDPHWDVENPSDTMGTYTRTAVSGTNYNGEYVAVQSPYDTEPNFLQNEQRGCSYLFNFACVRHFITENGILCVIRAHEAMDEGYKLYRAHPTTLFPAMMTVFSAPNYCDTFNNRGAIVTFADQQMNIKQFYSSPHPYYLPNFMNAFTWSSNFVVSKVRAALEAILMTSFSREALDGFRLELLEAREESQQLAPTPLAIDSQRAMNAVGVRAGDPNAALIAVLETQYCDENMFPLSSADGMAVRTDAQRIAGNDREMLRRMRLSPAALRALGPMINRTSSITLPRTSSISMPSTTSYPGSYVPGGGEVGAEGPSMKSRIVGVGLMARQQQEQMMHQDQMLQQEPVMQQQQQPTLHREPIMQHDPLISHQQPMVQQDLVMHQQPTLHQDPLTHQDPLMQHQSTFQQDPLMQRDPLTQNQPTSHEDPLTQPDPLLDHDPLTQYQPTSHEDPLAQKDPLTRPDPLIQHDPLKEYQPTLHEDPLTQQDPLQHEPLTQNQPILHEDPLMQQDPVLHPDPLTQDQPTSQNDPTLEQDQILPQDPLTQHDP